jgi:HAMP domain-containing protein
VNLGCSRSLFGYGGDHHNWQDNAMKLRGKVNLTLCGAFVVGLSLAGGIAYKVLTDEAIDNSTRDARIMMEEASAVRSYTAEFIFPQLQPQLKIQFLPTVVSAFAAQTNFHIVQKKLPEYNYREPTLNPTNVADKAADWEAEIINDFKQNPSKAEMMSIRDTPTGEYLTLSRPLKVGSQTCLSCHSTPENAPPTMVALYGSQNGFGWKQGDIIGAQVVSIPLSVPMQRAYTSLGWLLGALAASFVVIVLIVDALLRALVVKPVIGISRMASEVSMGKMDEPEYSMSTNDEIGSLASSFNRMRRSLQNAMRMLEEKP